MFGRNFTRNYIYGNQFNYYATHQAPLLGGRFTAAQLYYVSPRAYLLYGR